MSVRVRFAPSPSGDLHVGNARTALFNWLYARKSGGTCLFRVEDSDADRSDEGSIRAIRESLAWLGLDPDEGEGFGGPHAPYRQSEAAMAGLYRTQARALLDQGRAYWCYDDAREQEAERQRLLHHPEERKRRHPHRDLDAAAQARLRAEGREPALRFAADDLVGAVSWDDAVRGGISVDLSEIRDFNLLKSDGTPMYNWACVVDDHRMGITDVLRGEDGISNTPRQLLLYRALGWEPPRFGHLAFILGPDGQKLSKRHGDTGVGTFRSKGYLPEALLNYLGLLGLGGEGEGAEVFDSAALVERFSLERLVKKASVFDYGKLDFLNAHWLRAVSPGRLRALAAPFLEGLAAPSEQWLDQALDTFKGNAVRLSDLREPLEALLASPSVAPVAVAAAKAFVQPLVPAQALLQVLEQDDGYELTREQGLNLLQNPALEQARMNPESWVNLLKSARNRAVASGVKGKDFFMPLRLALTGSEHGPELPKILALLSLESVEERLRAFLRVAE